MVSHVICFHVCGWDVVGPAGFAARHWLATMTTIPARLAKAAQVSHSLAHAQSRARSLYRSFYRSVCMQKGG